MQEYIPLVSAIIPTYNRAHFVSEAIDSVLAQTYTNFEIVVVNDGSADDTMHVLQAYGTRIRVVNKPNGGLTSARNRGIVESRGELIAFLDDDDKWLPHKLEKQVPEFADPDVCLVHTAGRFINEATGWDKTQFVGDIGFHELLAMHVIYGQTVVVRKSVIDELGPFDAEYNSSVEDLELWLRIAQNHKIKGIDACTAEIRCHEAAMHNNLRRMYTCNMRVIDKYSHVHVNCAECASSVRTARRYLRVYAYEECKIRARRALKKRAYFEAIRLRFEAFRYDPSALALLPVRTMKRLVGRSA
jgi:glycosyltransferase involved in cell wall biosynthesis